MGNYDIGGEQAEYTASTKAAQAVTKDIKDRISKEIAEKSALLAEYGVVVEGPMPTAQMMRLRGAKLVAPWCYLYDGLLYVYGDGVLHSKGTRLEIRARGAAEKMRSSGSFF